MTVCLRRLLTLIFVGAGFVPGSASAQNLSFNTPGLGLTGFQLTSTTLIRWREDNFDFNAFDDDFYSIYQRLDMSLQTDTLRLETRIDAFFPFVGYVYDGGCPTGIENDPRCYLQYDVRPERLTLRWTPNSELTAEAGDAQLILGRGAALAFRKVDLLGVDTALRGAHAIYRGDILQGRVHGGLANPQNQDPIDLRIIEDLEDVVVSGAAGVRIPGDAGVTTNLQGVWVSFEDEEAKQQQNREVLVGGLTFEAPFLLNGNVSLYAEGNVMRRSFDVRGPQTDVGRAVYASAQLQLQKLTLLAEWKDYTNFLVAPELLEGNPWRIYSAAPLVDYDGPQRLRAIGNQRGGALRFDYAFLPGPWSFGVNTAFFGLNEEFETCPDSDPECVPEPADPFDGVLVSHSWVELVRRQEYSDGFSWGFNTDFGARFEILNFKPLFSQLEPGDLDRQMIHGMAEGTVGLGQHSLDVVVDHRHERERIGDELRDFEIGGTSVTYSYGIRVAATASVRWSTFRQGQNDRREPGPDNRTPYNFLGGQYYPSVEIRYSFTPGTFISYFFGATPGGQICSGGVCRDVPPYEGFSLQFVARI